MERDGGPVSDRATDQPRSDRPRVDTAAPDSWKVAPPVFKSIPKGSFSMGSAGPAGGADLGADGGPPEAGSGGAEACRQSNESLHQVTLTRGFEIATSETTQGHFAALLGYNPSSFSGGCGSTCPVQNVSWYEAAAYCNALSAQTAATACYSCSNVGKPSVICTVASAYSGAKIYDCPGFRLPTEAEWERAYRAGTATAFYSGGISSCNGTDANAGAIGWYDKNSSNKSHPVARKQANSWGLYDMAGNVWEWCHDWYAEDPGMASRTDPWGAATGTSRVLRGGSWFSAAGTLRAAHRGLNPPADRGRVIGFRCVRSKK